MCKYCDVVRTMPFGDAVLQLAAARSTGDRDGWMLAGDALLQGLKELRSDQVTPQLVATTILLSIDCTARCFEYQGQEDHEIIVLPAGSSVPRCPPN